MEPRRVWRAAAAAAVLAALPAPAQQQTDRPAAPAPSRHPSYDSVVVARVGDRTVTGREFLLSYEFGPAFPKRGEDARQRYLGFMINEKLLALEGYAKGLDRVRSAREMIEEIEGDLITEQLYRHDVAPRVKITDAERARAIRRDRTGIRIRWLYDADSAGIMRAAAGLRGGTAFDTLFALQLNDSVKPDDRSMATTLFGLDRSNPELARVVDTLAPGSVALPIRAPDGWYLVRCDERSQTPVMTQTEEAKVREDVERALVQQHADSLSDRYVDRLMRGRRPVIQRRAFDILEAHLAVTILHAGRAKAWGVDERLRSRWGVGSSATLTEAERGQVLVKLEGRSYTVGDFLRWFRARDTFLNLRLGSPQAFFASLERFVWRMVRDKLLVERARRRGYDRMPEVRNYRRWWMDKIVFELAKNQIADSIPMTPELLRAYYDAHLRDYRDTSGVQVPYERASDDVRRDYYNGELTRRMLHRLVALRQRYGVSVDEKILGALPAGEGADPSAIDVYAVKKGGTFPHRAFPSIDYEWQRWD